jgi:transcriptional regulator with XRE-family HTH domain
MNSVEKVLNLCKERKIAVSKLEKECGFANGYIRQLKKGTFPTDRLQKIADYFGLPLEYFLDKKEAPTEVSADQELTELLETLKNRPDMRLLFNLASTATPEDVMRAVKIIEALKEE